MSNYIENCPYDSLEVGDSASVSQVLTKKDIELFAVMSGDINPAHLDEEYAKSEMFHDVIGHGMWSASLFSTLLGTRLPGPGTIYLKQSLEFKRPVKVGDKVTATVTVKEKPKPERQHLILTCTCINQEGKQVLEGEACVIAPVKKVRRKKVSLPNIQVQENRYRFYDELIAFQEQLEPLLTAVVHPVDANALGGAIAAATAGVIRPILVGPEHKIRSIAQQEGYDLSPYTVVNTQHSHEAAEVAVRLAKTGDVEALMKGKLHSSELMGAVLDKKQGLRTARRLSHVSVLDVPNYHKPLFLTDSAINIRPSLAEKKDIVQNAIDLFLTLGRGMPKVAIVSAVETVNEAIPSTLDATALCKMAERGQISGGILDGPLGFDSAVSNSAAKAKDIHSAVAGNADIIVVPDIEAGNMLYKQMRFLSNVESAGIVMGAQVPVILTSRAASAGQTRVASCALALRYARALKTQ